MALVLRLALAILLVFVAAAEAGACRRLLQAQQKTVAGKAVVISRTGRGHEHARYLAVHTADGRRVQVQHATEAQLTGIHTGMEIEVTGEWQAAGSGMATSQRSSFKAASIRASGAAFAAPKVVTGATNIATSPVSEAAAPDVAPAIAAAVTLSTNQLIAAELPTLVVPIAAVTATGAACPGTAAPRATADAVREVVFGNSSSAGVSVSAPYNKCSYGKTQLNTNNSRVVDTVELPCSGNTNGVAWTFSKCDFDDFNGYADAADAQLQAQGVDLSQYKYRVYLVPPSACSFVGLGYIGCDHSFQCRAWVGPDFWSNAQALSHELGHNLFLGHAGSVNADGSRDDYADDSGTMGYCCTDRCPNTPHAWQLGWISVRQLDGNSLKAGQTVNVTLATQATSARSGLRISPSWAAGQPPIFLGYRTRVAGDAAMDSSQAGKVHVYTAPITNTYDPQLTTWKAGLSGVGASWTNTETGLVVRVKSVLAGRATVSVCRKGGAETLASCQAGQDRDCNGLAGGKDPRCVQLLRRARLGR